MTLHAAPRIVALPARVELAASPSQSCVEPRGTTVASKRTAGTLLIRFDSSAERPTSQTSPPDWPPTVDVKPPWIAAESPETRTPSRTIKRPTKKRMMLQSTFAIRARAVVSRRRAGKTGRTSRRQGPPTATRPGPGTRRTRPPRRPLPRASRRDLSVDGARAPRIPDGPTGPRAPYETPARRGRSRLPGRRPSPGEDTP